MIRLKRLRAGSYETTDGQYFTYIYKPEDGARPGWLLYAKTDNGMGDAFLGFFDTLTDAKAFIASDIAYMNGRHSA